MAIHERDSMREPSPLTPASLQVRGAGADRGPRLLSVVAAVVAAAVTLAAVTVGRERAAVLDRIELPGRGGETHAGGRWGNDDVERLGARASAVVEARADLEEEIRRAAGRGVPLRVLEATTGLERREIFAIMRRAK